ncbi:nucleoside deaminase [Heliophilum fasciatum]|uniref:Guanine deaminase n=1 Tax=Heliophilum fasciatum TaxID=35700 RepID=A0A4R2RM24_9FIRM|nr:nucleoside deaminase [Heliophilum fasciatum]MCW2277665.1 guanine deaminase [Heliophilum fasciatum]TCP65012.1 guanine deaminase [Heliophilum fasciatum]
MSRFMEIACASALQGITAGNGGPFGAAIVQNGKVIATGHNRVIADHDSTAHAEIMAIRKAEQVLGTHDLSGCELYTTCYPCPMCLGAILWARIDKVYYGCSPDDAAQIGFDDKLFYEVIANPSANPCVTLEQEDRESCLDLFKKWMGLPNKKPY